MRWASDRNLQKPGNVGRPLASYQSSEYSRPSGSAMRRVTLNSSTVSDFTESSSISSTPNRALPTLLLRMTTAPNASEPIASAPIASAPNARAPKATAPTLAVLILALRRSMFSGRSSAFIFACKPVRCSLEVPAVVDLHLANLVTVECVDFGVAKPAPVLFLALVGHNDLIVGFDEPF
jgi:hypothetical protein